jgi:prepilin-type processing-associated H-X9-DG protein
LLVVIAIISLLVSILLPSLTRAKDLARNVVCLNLIRSQGTAMVFYHNDNDMRCPPLRDDDYSTSVYARVWAGYLLQYLGETDYRSISNDFFACPSSVPNLANYIYRSRGNNACMDYGMSISLGGKEVSSTFHLQPDYTDSNTLLIGESANRHSTTRVIAAGWFGYALAPYWSLAGAGAGWGGMDDTRHNGHANVLMGDGHVESGSELEYHERDSSGALKYNWGY